MQYSESTIYGFNLIIREYAHFPRILPLPCHIEHGWVAGSYPLVTDLAIDKPLMLVFSRRRLEAWRRKSNIPVAIIGSPFIHYKNMHNIHQRPDAKGTIVFPSHSTEDVDTIFDIKKYCQELKRLPKKFQPITICLFWPDYINKSADIYRKAGFSVVTAGRKYKIGLSFVKNFYEILSSYQFVSSNEVGSYTFYAIDLGMPFFLLGEYPLKVNISGNKDMGKTTKINENYYGRLAHKIFSTGPTTQIRPEQAKFVSDEMGKEDCLSSSKMNSLLWRYWKREPHRTRAILAYWTVSILLFFGIASLAQRILNIIRRTSVRIDKLS